MMDFGLAGLLDRIERDFGLKAAKLLTLLIGIAIVAGCLTLIGNLVEAFFGWLSGITSESTFWAKVYYIGKHAVGVCLLAILGRNLATASLVRSHYKSAQQSILEAESIYKEVNQQLKNSGALADRNMIASEQNQALINKLLALIDEIKAVSPDQFQSDLRQLRSDTIAEMQRKTPLD
jgi:hypothetical protein